MLLFLRVSVFESGMFKMMRDKNIARGNFTMFFTNKTRFKKYMLSILIGLPTWYVIGILVAFSNKFGKEFGITEEINPGKAIMYAYVALSVGDVLAGLLSQYLRSRKSTLYIFYALSVIMITAYFLQGSNSSSLGMYLICAGLGFSNGYWAIFVTMAAEQFGTNLRATAATTVPNMVRGALPMILLLFNWLQHYFSYSTSGFITGAIIMVITVASAMVTQETFGKELNYMEPIGV
jgi:hypothetical protein